MSHSIIAHRPGVDRQETYEDLGLHYEDDTWLERYMEYQRQTQVAQISRSAGNPLNIVIYAALGVTDEAYAGCSGNGITLEITRAQFEAAWSILQATSLKITRPRNMADGLLDSFKGTGIKVIGESPLVTEATGDDLQPERKFCELCIEYLQLNDLDTLRVSFE